MSKWVCPECGGGFPQMQSDDKIAWCPWCGYNLQYSNYEQ